MYDPSQGPLWVIHSAFSSEIDFLIWLLEVDGLKVSPFDQHSEGNFCLRDQGMTEEMWLSWFTTTVLLSDSRLHWKSPYSHYELGTSSSEL
jgi:hypothetical protein